MLKGGQPNPWIVGKGGFINLIGEYNIAGDLWLVEPLFKEAGIQVLSRITGDSTFEEITYAHRAKLNVVVCSRALINVAKGMERKYGIPFVEVSFFGKTEMSKAMRIIGSRVRGQGARESLIEKNRINYCKGRTKTGRKAKGILKSQRQKSHSLCRRREELVFYLCTP